MCCTKRSSVVNSIYSGQKLFSETPQNTLAYFWTNSKDFCIIRHMGPCGIKLFYGVTNAQVLCDTLSVSVRYF
jgi:hypothetical protein